MRLLFGLLFASTLAHAATKNCDVNACYFTDTISLESVPATVVIKKDVRTRQILWTQTLPHQIVLLEKGVQLDMQGQVILVTRDQSELERDRTRIVQLSALDGKVAWDSPSGLLTYKGDSLTIGSAQYQMMGIETDLFKTPFVRFWIVRMDPATGKALWARDQDETLFDEVTFEFHDAVLKDGVVSAHATKREEGFEAEMTFRFDSETGIPLKH